jgi:iron complex transport system substrate-binding protein
MESPPRRIISLAPNITEILFALGLEDSIVGVTRFCDYPPQVVNITKIGGLVDPNLEKIISLNPDLIIGFRGNPIRILEKMQEFHLPVFIMEMGTTIDSVFEIIKTVGTITWMEDRADTLIHVLKTRYQKILAAVEDVHFFPKVFFSLHGLGLWTCGKGSFMDDLVRKAKGINIAGNIQKKWLLLSQEHLIQEDPDFIIILSRSQKEFLKAKKWIKKRVSFKNLQAVKTDKIYFLDENLATRPGPRIFDALDHLARLIHPDKFSNL